MVAHVNFYESIDEARMRLYRTIVMYDAEPFYVIAISNHNADGIFRIYMRPLNKTESAFDYVIDSYGHNHTQIGKHLDKYLADNTSSIIVRKQMNSPHFNKFRPFPLGMCNDDGRVFYNERQPTRKTEQGLTSSMVVSEPVSLTKSPVNRFRGETNIFTEGFRECILGAYPTAVECLENLKDPTISNEAAAFNRCFAFVRGPIDMMFLAYKNNVVGVLPTSDFSSVRLGRDFAHVKEAVQSLNLFTSVIQN